MTQPPSEAGKIHLFVGLGSLAVLTVLLFNDSGSSPLVFAVIAPALLGLLFRYTSAPAIFLLLLSWQAVYPSMIPVSNPTELDLRRSHFKLETLLVVAAALVYLTAQFRLYSIKGRAFPPDAVEASRKQKARKREAAGFQVDELFPAGLVVLGSIIAASFVWLIVASLKIEPSEFPPFVGRRGNEFDPRSQFLILAGLAAVCGVILGFGFRYASWTRLTPIWGRQYLIDVAWLEHRRELNRQDKRRADAVRKPAVAPVGSLPRRRRKRPRLSLRDRLRTLGCVVTVTVLAAAVIFAVLILLVGIEARFRR